MKRFPTADGLKRDSHDGYRRLWLEVLAQALTDCCARDRNIKRQAQAWISNRQIVDPFCAIAGVPTDQFMMRAATITKRLRKFRDHASRLQFLREP